MRNASQRHIDANKPKSRQEFTYQSTGPAERPGAKKTKQQRKKSNFSSRQNSVSQGRSSQSKSPMRSVRANDALIKSVNSNQEYSIRVEGNPG